MAICVQRAATQCELILQLARPQIVFARSTDTVCQIVIHDEFIEDCRISFSSVKFRFSQLWLVEMFISVVIQICGDFCFSLSSKAWILRNGTTVCLKDLICFGFAARNSAMKCSVAYLRAFFVCSFVSSNRNEAGALYSAKLYWSFRYWSNAKAQPKRNADNRIVYHPIEWCVFYVCVCAAIWRDERRYGCVRNNDSVLGVVKLSNNIVEKFRFLNHFKWFRVNLPWLFVNAY